MIETTHLVNRRHAMQESYLQATRIDSTLLATVSKYVAVQRPTQEESGARVSENCKEKYHQFSEESVCNEF